MTTLPKDAPEQVWQPIPGYEGWYSASSEGHIRRDPGSPYCKDGYVLKQYPHSSAATKYYRVNLSKEGKVRSVCVHRLVLLTFRGPCPDGKVGCHGEGGSLDNRLENLEYDTQQANIRQSIWMQSQQEASEK